MNKHKLFTLVFLLIFTFVLHANPSVKITSSIKGGVVSYLAPVGSIVKKGDMLVKFRTAIAENNIRIAKINYAIAVKNLKDSKLNHIRSSQLVKSKSISEKSAYNDYFSYKISELEVEKMKLEIDNMCSRIFDFSIETTKDCRVLKVYVAENCGTNVGDRIMDIEYVENTHTQNPKNNIQESK